MCHSSKYACVVPLKDKNGTIIVNAFQNILNDPERKPRKIWVDQDSEFYKNSLKKWLKYNVMEVYSTYNEGKSAYAGRIIRTLINTIYKHMTAVSKKCLF